MGLFRSIKFYCAVATFCFAAHLSFAQFIPFNYWKRNVPPTPPNAPTNLIATATTSTTITLGWDDNSNNEAQFQFQMCEGSGCSTFADVAASPLAANTVMFEKTSLFPGGVYRFRVRAQNAIGDSTWATSADITTVESVPLAPTNFTVINKGRNNINFRFNDNSNNEDDFEVQMCQGAGCSSWSAIAASPLPASSNTFVFHDETGLTQNTTYRFRIRASNAIGDSAWLESSDITTEDGVDANLSQVIASAGNMPHDDSAYVTVLVRALSSTSQPLSGETIEVLASTGTATLSGSAACRTPAATCATATDIGNGWYRATAKTATLNTVTFSAVAAGAPDVNIVQTTQTVFDTNNFTVFSAGGTVSSGNAGQNLYFSGGTTTFNSTTVGQTYGDIVINGGVVVHASGTSANYYKIDVNAASLNMNTGGANLNGRGFAEVSNEYSSGYTTSATAPSTALSTSPGYYNGGSHGGQAGRRNSPDGSPNPVYDNFRDPYLPGSNDSVANRLGGGVFRLVTTGMCTIDSGAYIYANGNSGGGAGGTVNLRCAHITGTAGGDAIQANGGVSATSQGGGGGGGRVALVSSGTKDTFSGNFRYPYDHNSAIAFIEKVQAMGGVGGGSGTWDYAHGGAGTIYIEASDVPDGTLIVSNEWQTHRWMWSDVGYTRIEGFRGTVNGAHAPGTTTLNINLTAPAASLTANHTDYYKGHHIRIEKGDPDDWSDDEFYLITGNTQTTVTLATGLNSSLSGGENYHTALVLDSIYMNGGADLKTNSDLYIKNGSIEDYGGENIVIRNAVIITENNSQTKMDSGGHIRALMTSGDYYFQSPTPSNHEFIVSGGRHYVYNTNSDYDFVMTSGEYYSYTMNINGNIMLSGTSGNGLQSNTMNAINYIQDGGQLTHWTASTTQYYTQKITVDSFTINGGGINASSRGFVGITSGLSTAYTTSSSSPSTALGGGSGSYVGGGHGGTGGRENDLTSGTSNPVYDDFRNPYLPGASDHSSNNGGGAVIVNSTNSCTINNGGYIYANGSGGGGAGGTINLRCASIGGTAGANALQANGGSQSSGDGGGGGGGRIALVSSGDQSTFTGSFTYPNSKAGADALLSVVEAKGGAGACCGYWSYGHGGAGTIYLEASDVTNGTLLLNNEYVTQNWHWSDVGYVQIPGFYGTVNGAHSASDTNVSLNLAAPAGVLGAAYGNYYKGYGLRVEKGVFDDWADDERHLITGNNTSSVDLATGLAGALSDGDSYRTIVELDSIYITGGAQIRTYSDMYIKNGSLEDYGGVNFPITNGMIIKEDGADVRWDGGGEVYITLNTGTLFYQVPLPSDYHLTLAGGYTYINTINSDHDITVTGGEWSIPNLTTAGDLTVNGTSGNGLRLRNVNVNDFVMNGGVITHDAANSSQYFRILMNANSFTINGGGVNVNSKGFEQVTNGLSSGYTTSSSSPSTALGGGSGAYVGGSHGGYGGREDDLTSGTPNPVYDNFRDPYLPGANDHAANNGGGVFKLTSAGICTINSGGYIYANGATGGGAGGTINLRCGGFSGNAAANAFQANGGSQSSGGGGGGGGGRIALVSTGPKTGFSGSFTYPTNKATADALLSVIEAKGGGGACCGYWSYGHGGAGTIYLEASDASNGTLLINNEYITHRRFWNDIGYTRIAGFYGTVNGAHSTGASTVNLNLTAPAGSLSAAHADYYKGHGIRIEKGIVGDWTDDEIHLITGNDTGSVDLATTLSQNVNDGDAYRTVILLDSIYLNGGVDLRIDSDLYVINGSLEDYGGVNFPISNSVITEENGAEVRWGNAGVVQVTLAGGNNYFQTGIASDVWTYLTGGDSYIYDHNSPIPMNITGGTWYFSQNLIVNGDLSFTNSTFTSKVANSTNMTINSGTFSTESITTGDYIQNAGTLTHRAATSSNYYALNMSADNFTMNGGTVNVNGKGFAQISSGLSSAYTASATTPTTALGGTSGSYVAGSHGGYGGREDNLTSANPNPVYDDFRDPYLPGANDHSDNNGGGVFKLTSPGECQVNYGATIHANGNTGGGAGGTINLRCSEFTGTAAVGAIQARGGDQSGGDGGGGGGGRIAFVSSGPKTNFSGSFTYPFDDTSLNDWLDLASARGGAGACCGYWSYGQGGAGTLYLEASDIPKGSLIISNKGTSVPGVPADDRGYTPFINTTANANIVFSSLSANEIQITNGGTPFNNMVNYFRNALIHVWNTGTGDPNPLDPSHIPVILDTGNTNNTFQSTSGSFPAIANDHEYRVVYDLEHLYVGYNSDVRLQGADLILGSCDITDANSKTFTIPAGSTLSGNSFASAVCLDAFAGTKGSTLNFTNYYLNPALPPAAPTNLLSLGETSSSINLGWTDNANNEDDFQIQMCTGAGCTNFSDMAESPLAADSVTLNKTGLTANTFYRFRIRARNTGDNSAWATSGDIKTNPLSAPNDPTNLQASETAPDYIDLVWDDNSNDEDHFQLQWCEGSGCSSFVDAPESTIAANETSLTKIGLDPATTYRFRIRAQNAVGDSGWSTTGDITTNDSIPNAPTNFTIISKGRNNINFQFRDNAGNEDNFDVEMCQGSGCATWAAVTASPLSATSSTFKSHNETGLTQNTTYRFRVRATNGTGSSSWLTSGDITTEDGVDANLSQVLASAGNMPNDDSAYVTLLVRALSANSQPMIGETIEVAATTGTATLSGASACRTPAATCTTATDIGNGWYRATAKTSTLNTVTFSAVAAGAPDVNIVQTAQTVFDTSNFTVFSAGGTVNSGHAGQNLYFTGGTATFNASAVGQTYGDIVVNGGVIAHATATASLYYKIDIQTDSFNVISGGVNLNNRGFEEVTDGLNTGYPTSATIPSIKLSGNSGNYAGGSHGGRGGRWDQTGATPNPVYDNFRDPYLPGANDSNGGRNGGGAFRLVSTGACTVDSGAYLYANGENYGGAGGTINLRCAHIGGTAAANAIQANGGQGNSAGNSGPGGGGRIALVSSGDKDTFTGSFHYPRNKATADSFLGIVEAKGGAGVNSGYWSYGHAGAGTIYLEASDVSDGTLLVSNENLAHQWLWNDSGYTHIPGFIGTVNGAHSASDTTLTISLTAPTGVLSADHLNYYKGHNVRIAKGVANDWSDDEFHLISANNTTTLTLATGLAAGLVGGESYRTAVVLDSIYMTNGVELRTYSDLYIKNGSLEDYGGNNLVLNNSLITSENGAEVQFDGGGTIYTTFSSGSYLFQGSTPANSELILNGGSTYINVVNGSGNTVVNSGNWYIPTMNLDASLIVNGTTGNGLQMNTLNAINYIQEGGLVKQWTANASTYYTQKINVDHFEINGGGINVNGTGFAQVTSGLSSGYTTSSSAPSTALGGGSGSYVGGSHGGRGGRENDLTSGTSNPVYDDFRNPYLPGANDHAANNGGGAVIVNSTGDCVINSGGYIYANGNTGGGAGGTINLRCASIGGNAGANALQANGGNQSAGGGGGGGGGRIALVSSGAKSTFTGSFAYPTDKTSADSLLSVVEAKGGAGACCGYWSYGHGGAGTIYLEASDVTNGTLLLNNEYVTQNWHWDDVGYVQIPGFYGTVNGAHSASDTNVSLNLTAPAGVLAAAYGNYYKGYGLRVEKGVVDDWTDDERHLITGNDTTSVDLATGLSGALSDGDSYRTIMELDSIYITGGAQVRTYSDMYIKNGSLEDYGGVNFPITNGMIIKEDGADVRWDGGGEVYITLNSGTLFYQVPLPSDFHLTLAGGLTYINTINSDHDVTVSGGEWNIPNFTTSGDLTVNGTSGAGLRLRNVNVNDFVMNGGVMTHDAATTSQYYRILMTANSFTINGGGVNVNGKGFEGITGGLSTAYTASSSTPTSALGGGSGNYVGGGHGGTGGREDNLTSGSSNPVYDNFRDPYLPGASDHASNNGGGVFKLTSAGTCTINSGGYIYANGNTGGGAGGTINLRCGGFAGTAAANALQANGGSQSAGGGGGGGGGRIALVSTGDKTSFAGSFAYPVDSTTLNTWLDLARARGGDGACCGYWSYGHGGAGTVYLEASDVPKGSLIVSNKGLTLSGFGDPIIGYTPFINTTANGNVLYSDVSTTEVQVTNGGTPFNNMVNYFQDTLIHIWNTGTADPLDVNHIPIVLDTGNTNNTFRSSSGSFPTISNDYNYRVVYDLEHLYVGYNADVRLQGADLIVAECDITSPGSTTFTIPAGSQLSGNSFASSSCLDATVSTKGSTVNFTNYFLQ